MGGLARRKTLVAEARRKGPVLLVDSGNALFKFPGIEDAPARARARFILDAMGRMQTAALAVGEKDLNAGPGWLAEAAKAARVQLLSANLEDARRRRVFPGSTVVYAGGLQLGLVGLTAPGKHGVLLAGPLLPAVRAQVAALRAKKVDAVLVLAAVPYGEALELTRVLGAEVELVIQSHEGRGPNGPQAVGEGWLISSPDRGRGVGQLQLQLSGTGKLRDAGELTRDRAALEHLDGQVAEVKRRLAAAAAPDVKAGLKNALAGFEQRRGELRGRLGRPGQGRWFELSYLSLGPDVESDPGLKAEAAKLEIPPGLH